MIEIISRQNDTVDRLAWRYYNSNDFKYVQALFDANYGLFKSDPKLPQGTVVKLPNKAVIDAKD